MSILTLIQTWRQNGAYSRGQVLFQPVQVTAFVTDIVLDSWKKEVTVSLGQSFCMRSGREAKRLERGGWSGFVPLRYFTLRVVGVISGRHKWGSLPSLWNSNGGMARVCKVAGLFLLERKHSQGTSAEAGGKQPTSRSLSPSNFVRHHEEQRWSPWLSRGMGMSQIWTVLGAPWNELLSLRREQCPPTLVNSIMFAVLSASKMLIFLASAFVFAEHHQESDWTKICIQVCLLSWDLKNGSTCCGNQQREPFAAGQRL